MKPNFNPLCVANSPFRTSILRAGSLAMMATGGISHAADFTWNVESGNWNVAASWLTGDPPITGVPAATDDAFFSSDAIGGSPVTVSLDGNKVVNSVTFQSSSTTLLTAGSSNRNLTMAAGLTVESGAGAVNLSTASNNSNGLQISADQTWTNDGTLTITSLIRPSVSTDSRTLTLTGSGATELSGAGRFRDILTLIKTGTGTLTLGGTPGNYTYTGELSIRAGTLSISAINNPTSNGMLGRGVLPVTIGDTGSVTGTLSYTGGDGSSTRAFTLATGGTGTFEVTEAATTLTLSGVFDGSGEFRKTGAGTLVLSNFANIHSGATVVAGGTLLVNGVTDALSAFSVTAGTLGGGGTVGGTVSVASGGSVAPGAAASVGQLSTGVLTFASGAIFDSDINTNSSAADFLSVGGDLALGNATLAVENLGAGAPSSFEVFTIASYAGNLTGTFNGLPEGATVPIGGRNFTISYVGDGNTITLTAPEVVGANYDAWALEKITNIEPSADATPGGDPDGDGQSNLAEFAFNGNPLSGSSNGQIYVLTADTDADTNKELILTMAVLEGGPSFEGSPSPTAMVAGVTYTVQGSMDLSDFGSTVVETAPVTAGIPNVGNGYEYRSFQLSGSNGLSGQGFLRATVEN